MALEDEREGAPRRDGGPGALRRHRAALLLSIPVILGAVAFVAASLRTPSLPTFIPTAPQPREVGEALVGPRVYTVDASNPERWVFFDFSRGSVVEGPEPEGWDLAFRRFHVITNGGEGFPGEAGARDLGPVPFDSLERAPEVEYELTRVRSDSTHPAFAEWYDYSWLSHVLTPRPHTWLIRTVDGRHAKLQILGYYCPGARPGCLTFRYLYQGDGSRVLRPPPRPGPSAP